MKHRKNKDNVDCINYTTELNEKIGSAVAHAQFKNSAKLIETLYDMGELSEDVLKSCYPENMVITPEEDKKGLFYPLRRKKREKKGCIDDIEESFELLENLLDDGFHIILDEQDITNAEIISEIVLGKLDEERLEEEQINRNKQFTNENIKLMNILARHKWNRIDPYLKSSCTKKIKNTRIKPNFAYSYVKKKNPETGEYYSVIQRRYKDDEYSSLSDEFEEY